MNKTLRLLLFTGLAAIFCASCSKVEEIFPESFTPNDNKPFFVEKVPIEGGIVALDRMTGGVPAHLNPESTSLTFQIGDTLILTATPKNGYTFINWVRNGVPVSTQPKYTFVLDGKDIENGHVKYHYEARFGLDYALQVIPSIDEVMPAELIKVMGPYLHFGDNPPRIDTCFSAIDFIVLDTLIQNDPTEDYNFSEQPQTFPYPKNTFLFEGQHRCIIEKHYYERCNYPEYFYYSADAADNIFVMGHDNCFTVYFKQTWRAWIHPDLAGLDHLKNLTRTESIILCGKMGNEGVEDFHWGMYVESYDPANYPYIGADPGHSGQPGIHDIMVFSYKDDDGNNVVLPYDPTFQKHQ
jgi:hypothetical protein